MAMLLLLICLLPTTLSSLVGGTFGVVGSAIQTAGQGSPAAAGAATGAIESGENLRAVLQKAVTAGMENLSEADRQTAINALVQHTGMSRPEAEQRLAQ
jgi:hypothetical protein